MVAVDVDISADLESDFVVVVVDVDVDVEKRQRRIHSYSFSLGKKTHIQQRGENSFSQRRKSLCLSSASRCSCGDYVFFLAEKE